jgi:hypothetical protein
MLRKAGVNAKLVWVGSLLHPCSQRYNLRNLYHQDHSRNCVIRVVRVRTLGSVGSRTQLSLRCNFSDYVLRKNHMFRPMVAIFSLSYSSS